MTCLPITIANRRHREALCHCCGEMVRLRRVSMTEYEMREHGCSTDGASIENLPGMPKRASR